MNLTTWNFRASWEIPLLKCSHLAACLRPCLLCLLFRCSFGNLDSFSVSLFSNLSPELVNFMSCFQLTEMNLTLSLLGSNQLRTALLLVLSFGISCIWPGLSVMLNPLSEYKYSFSFFRIWPLFAHSGFTFTENCLWKW